jgi:acrylyl-CoA reductase (NADPH)
VPPGSSAPWWLARRAACAPSPWSRSRRARAGGADLPAAVLPFILCSVSPLGIGSARCPRERRIRARARLRDLLPAEQIDGLATEIGLSEVPAWAERILAGQGRGRAVVNVGR